MPAIATSTPTPPGLVGLSLTEALSLNAAEVKDACAEYLARGLKIVHFEVSARDMTEGRGKGPRERNWQEIEYGVPPMVGHRQVGLKMGTKIEVEGETKGLYLACVDIDDVGLLPMAEQILPPTGVIGGRENAARSHRFYLTPDPCNSFSWSGMRGDGQRGATIELFGVTKSGKVGHQVLVSPSRHFKSGFQYIWAEYEGFGIVTCETLQKACKRLAELTAGCEITKGRGLPAKFSPGGPDPIQRLAPPQGILQDAPGGDEAEEKADELQSVTLGPADAPKALCLTPQEIEMLIVDAAAQASNLEAGSRQSGLNRISYVTASILSGGEAPDEAYQNLRERLTAAADNMPLPEINMRVWVDTIIRAVADGRRNPRIRPRLHKYHLTSQGLTDLLVEEWRDHYRYVQEHKSWLRWNGNFWEAVQSENILRDMVYVLRWAQAEAARCPNKRFGAAAWKWYFKCENGDATSRAEKLLHSDLNGAGGGLGLGVHASELDADPWLYCTASGYFDIRTGTLNAPVRESLVTKATPYAYIAGASSPRFEAHMDFVFGEQPDKDVAKEYFASWLGYCMTGVNKEQAILVLYGNGRNGKTKCLCAIQEVSGKYATVLAREVLIHTDAKTGNNDEVAELAGKRWGFQSESEPQDFLSEGRVKALTGGETVRGQRKYQLSTEFPFITKLLLDTNYKPRIHSLDLGILRRLRFIPMKRTIPDNMVCKTWREDLCREEGNGLLTWLLDQAHKYWTRGGLAPEPRCVSEAYLEYKDANDNIGAFLAECCNTREDDHGVEEGAPARRPQDLKCGAAELYGAYNNWAKANGLFPVSSRALLPKMLEKGFEPVKTRVGIIWMGVELRNTAALVLK